MKPNIKIILEDKDGTIIAQRDSHNWEVSEMNLDSLKRQFKKKFNYEPKKRNIENR